MPASYGPDRGGREAGGDERDTEETERPVCGRGSNPLPWAELLVLQRPTRGAAQASRERGPVPLGHVDLAG